METLTFYSEQLDALLTQILDLQNDDNSIGNAKNTIEARLPLTTQDGRRNDIGIRGKAYYSDSEDENDSKCDDEEHSEKFSQTGSSVEQNKTGASQGAAGGSIGNETIANVTSRPSKIRIVTNDSEKRKNFKTMRSPPSNTIVLSSIQHHHMVKTLTIPTTILNISLQTYVPKSPQAFVHTYPIHSEESDPLKPLKALKQFSRSLSITQSQSEQKPKYTLLILLQSGRFAAAIFCQSKCIQHTTKIRYTTRKGQGGAQSSKDGTKSISSIGSQLRRAGEVQLRSDIQDTLLQWGRDGLLQNCGLGMVQISKLLQKGFWEDVKSVKQTLQKEGHLKDEQGLGGQHWILQKDSIRVQPIPLDVGRPSFETCCAVYEVMMTCSIQEVSVEDLVSKQENEDSNQDNANSDKGINQNESGSTDRQPSAQTKLKKQLPVIPLTSLHIAAKEGDLDQLQALLECKSQDEGSNIEPHSDLNTAAGPHLMTPLHYATLTTTQAVQCVSFLLQHHADPTRTDGHNRPPYYLASNEPLRRVYRRARADLGEGRWDWTAARVGPALEAEDVELKRLKRAEKKKRQKERQKEAKRKEKEETLDAERQQKIEQEKKESEEEARRARAGLKPRKAGSGNGLLCDFCQVECKGKRKSQMFTRLDFKYCSTECVKKHQRELSAAAAMSRFSS